MITHTAWAIIFTLATIGILFAAAATADKVDEIMAVSVVAR